MPSAYTYEYIVLDAINLQIKTLESGALASGPDGTGWTQEEIDQRLVVLRGDHKIALAHRGADGSVVFSGEPSKSPACREERACSHIRELGRKYL